MTTHTTEKEIILARLEVLSPEIHFTSGVDGASYSRDQMIEHIVSGDPVGEEYIKVQMSFLRAFKNGELTKILSS